MNKAGIIGITLSAVGLLVLIATWIITSGNPAPPIENLPHVYESGGEKGISARYPKGWTIDTAYAYDNLGSEEQKIYGLKFHIPESLVAGTNLSSSDTGVSIEVLPGMSTCTAYPFLISPGVVETKFIDGVAYSVASSTAAAAGNRYEETIYALVESNPCIAIRYFIHYGAIENYPEAGAVKEFDKTALLKQFDEIRATLIVGK
jgi:hypothetical protein